MCECMWQSAKMECDSQGTHTEDMTLGKKKPRNDNRNSTVQYMLPPFHHSSESIMRIQSEPLT